MAIQFNYFGYKYEIVDDDKKEVALIGAGNAPERCVVPKKVENNGSVYTVVEIKWSPFTDRDYYNKVNNTVKAVVLYPTIRIIGNNPFRNCSKLNEINIPDSVTEIGENAFYVCKSLTSITIPDSVTEIGYGAFYACNSLTSITIPDSVTKIGNGAFNDCSSLTSITIPTSVEKIGACAFFGSIGCIKLLKLTKRSKFDFYNLPLEFARCIAICIKVCDIENITTVFSRNTVYYNFFCCNKSYNIACIKAKFNEAFFRKL